MALNIKIDFNDCYPIRTLYQNSLLTTFDTILKNGDIVPIGISISEKMHPLIPNVYNFSFGPVDHNNQIDDTVKLYHSNHSKLFSTIVLSAFILEFYEKKMKRTIVILLTMKTSWLYHNLLVKTNV
jgi:hypothetical protein